MLLLYSPGEIPTSFLKTRQKYCAEENPLWRAQSSMERKSYRISFFALPSRDEVFRGRYAILFLKKLSEIYLADARPLGKGGDADGAIAVMLVDISLGGAYAVILIFGGVFLLRTLKK
jgi:hypothetical protein